MTTSTAVFDADTLTLAVQRVMAAIVAAADALPGVVTPPARQILGTAGVTWDCEMVFAAALTVQTGIPEPITAPPFDGAYTYPQAEMTMWTVTVECGIVRAITANPTVWGTTEVAPSEDQYLTDLVASSSDTAVLINAAQLLGARGVQFGPVPQHADMLAAQGGFAGVAMTVTIEAFPGPA